MKYRFLFFICVYVYLNIVGPLDYYNHFPFSIICLQTFVVF